MVAVNVTKRIVISVFMKSANFSMDPSKSYWPLKHLVMPIIDLKEDTTNFSISLYYSATQFAISQSPAFHLSTLIY